MNTSSLRHNAVKDCYAYHELLFSFLAAMTLIEGIAPNALIVRNASRWWQITWTPHRMPDSKIFP